MQQRLKSHPVAAAALLYSVVALAMTWPVAAGLLRDLPWDLGDPVLNCAILERNAQRLLLGVGGDFAALSGFWDARIFHPEPLTLAYSEHLFAETLQILPLYALTGNILLCYNLLFLSTFVLSALFAFLLARELTGRFGPALIAGLVYGFAPYRVEQLSHVQVLSSQWMPLVLFSLRRYFVSGRRAPLAWVVVALVAQNLSCGYYLLFFAPFVVAYSSFELVRGGARDRAFVFRLVAAGLVAATLTLPFLLPYRTLHASGSLLRERSEVEQFSADVYAYLTAPEELRLWGDVVRAYPAAEGQLFFGFLPWVLAVAAVVFPILQRRRSLAPRWAAVFVVAGSLAAVAILFGAGGAASDLVPGFSMRSLPRALCVSAVAIALWAALSTGFRELLSAGLRSSRGACLLGLLTAICMSWGPTLRAFGRPLMEGPYLLLYDYLPGFDGLRVPARFAMIGLLFLALLAGFGAVEMERRTRRPRLALVGCGALFLAEATAAPLAVNDVWSDPALHRPPARLAIGAEAPPIYRRTAALQRTAVLVEFPFGSDPYELRYMFHQPVHGLPLLNGFSGALPKSYVARRASLRSVLVEPDRAWRALAGSAATHAIVHEGVWGIPAKGQRVTRWLTDHGAVEVAREGADVLLALAR